MEAQGRRAQTATKQHSYLLPSLSSTASRMPPFVSPLNQVPYPALYLYPLNDSFIPKHISLLNNQRVKIGRQTNAKTVPAERNGYFDSKVLSRQHAEVWEEGGKVCTPVYQAHSNVFSGRIDRLNFFISMFVSQHVVLNFGTRFSSRMSKVPMAPSSMGNV